jgi:hypothetical protein
MGNKGQRIRIVGIILGAPIGICLVIGIIGVFILDEFIVSTSAPLLAKRLAPSAYPHSHLETKWYDCGSALCYESRTYHTSDSLDRVLMFLEKQMPGYIKEHDSRLGQYYWNCAEDRGLLAEHAAKFSCTSLFCKTYGEGIYPRACVTAHSDLGTETIIEVRSEWPVL